MLWEPHSYFQILELEGMEEAVLACTSGEEAATRGTGLSTGLSDWCAPPQKHYCDNSAPIFGYGQTGYYVSHYWSPVCL